MYTIKEKEILSNEYIMTLIRCKAQNLIGKAGYLPCDLKDIEQELFMHLITRLPKFDPAKATIETFADRLVERKIADLMRHNRAKIRDYTRRSFSLNEELENEEGITEIAETISQDEVDLRMGRYNCTMEERMQLQMDIKLVMAGLPPKLLKIAEMLQSQTLSEIARELGIPRSTLCENHLVQLRKIFEEWGMEACPV